MELKKSYEGALEPIQTLLGNQPDISQVELTAEWLSEVRLATIDLIILYAKIQKEYAIFQKDLLSGLSDADFKKYCRNESSTEAFVNGHFKHIDLLKQLKLMCEKYLPHVSPEVFTMVSAYVKQNK